MHVHGKRVLLIRFGKSPRPSLVEFQWHCLTAIAEDSGNYSLRFNTTKPQSLSKNLKPKKTEDDRPWRLELLEKEGGTVDCSTCVAADIGSTSGVSSPRRGRRWWGRPCFCCCCCGSMPRAGGCTCRRVRPWRPCSRIQSATAAWVPRPP